MKPWRCQVCGETYLGNNPAERCPFCGAAGKNLLSPAEYLDYGKVEMSEKSKNGCLKALDLENNNAAFYYACAAKAENQISKAIFKRLAKHELEHAELIVDMLGIEEKELPEVTIPATDAERFSQAHQHEQKAINFYIEVAQKAPERRVKEVFQALADIELEHLCLANIYK